MHRGLAVVQRRDNQAVAQPRQLAFQRLQVPAEAEHHFQLALGAVGFGLLPIDVLRFPRTVPFSRQGVQHRHQARPTGVDDSGLAQRRQLGLGEPQRVFGGGGGGGSDVGKREVRVGSCGVGRGAQHRDDGALDRLRDSAVHEPDGVGERDGKHLAFRRPVAGSLGEATQDLGEHDPGVPARTAHRADGQRLGDLGQARALRQLLRCLDRRRHRVGHVRAGVPVRNWEDVEFVDLRAFAL